MNDLLRQMERIAVEKRAAADRFLAEGAKRMLAELAEYEERARRRLLFGG